MMITACSVHDSVEQALQEEVYRVLYKPLDMGKVLVIVYEIMQEKQRESSL